MINNFEDKLPLDAFNELVSMGRVLDKPKFCLALLNIQSFAFGRILNNPVVLSYVPTHDPSDEEAISALNYLKANEKNEELLKKDARLIPRSQAAMSLALLVKWSGKKFFNDFLIGEK